MIHGSEHIRYNPNFEVGFLQVHYLCPKMMSFNVKTSYLILPLDIPKKNSLENKE